MPNIGTLTFCHQIIIDENKIARRINVTVSFEPDVNTPVIQSQDLFKQVTHDLVETILRLKAVVE
ncbi:conserved hypothetical protein [Xenorhabdus cabanillasii JM26]|uniref:Uncharacterized protein n=1 Tax=Xenorhabdus cabanillasii JM26 TaxID=1427517 RepID=W1JBV0_9GAMM|nr:conserved hypothetical protein [Xenorhabdus cabanillasii JM26]